MEVGEMSAWVELKPDDRRLFYLRPAKISMEFNHQGHVLFPDDPFSDPKKCEICKQWGLAG